MNQHIYLRAYMAGVVVPTVLLLVGVSAFMIARFMFPELAPIERVLIFPLVIVPNAFGLWNMLYVAQRSRWHLPIGLHGAALPFLIAPLGIVLASSLGFLRVTDARLVWFEIVSIPKWSLGFAPFIAIAAYYLIWKYLVGFLNRVQGIE
jgi:hypothetical protein